jgi:hypothetical protein
MKKAKNAVERLEMHKRQNDTAKGICASLRHVISYIQGYFFIVRD